MASWRTEACTPLLLFSESTSTCPIFLTSPHFCIEARTVLNTPSGTTGMSRMSPFSLSDRFVRLSHLALSCNTIVDIDFPTGLRTTVGGGTCQSSYKPTQSVLTGSGQPSPAGLAPCGTLTTDSGEGGLLLMVPWVACGTSPASPWPQSQGTPHPGLLLLR